LDLLATALAAPTGARCTVGPSQIPIAPAEPGAPLPRAFLPWRLSDDGPGARGIV
jgi:hypothetical protein